jgi:hypothetical protein
MPKPIAICERCGQYVYVDAAGIADAHSSFNEQQCSGQTRPMTSKERRMLFDDEANNA